MEDLYRNKDDGELYNLNDAIDYWCDNYDIRSVGFAEVFTVVIGCRERKEPQQLRFF